MQAIELPQNLEGERIILGSILIDNTLLGEAITAIRRGACFYSDNHRIIYRALATVIERGDAADLQTVSNELSSTGDLDRIGGFAYLAKCEATVLSPGNVRAHIRDVLDQWRKRRLFNAGRDIAESALDRSVKSEDAAAKAEAAIFEIISSARTSREPMPIQDVTRKALREIEDRVLNKQNTSGVMTGFYDLDAKTGGLQKSDLVILAARPSVGKSAMAMNIAQNIVGLRSPVAEKRPVAVFSLEMSAAQIANRMVASALRLDLHAMRNGKISREQLGSVANKMAVLANAPLFIDDTPAMTLAAIRSKSRRLVSQNPDMALIVIDYMQLMTTGKRAENRQQEVSEISRSLKDMARELDVPILALSQLSRDNEKRGAKEKRPRLSDLRESGSIEQDADVVMFVHRDSYYEDKTESGPQSDLAELIIGKQRNGPTGVIDLAFHHPSATFYSASKRERSVDVRRTGDDLPF